MKISVELVGGDGTAATPTYNRVSATDAERFQLVPRRAARQSGGLPALSAKLCPDLLARSAHTFQPTTLLQINP